MRIRRAIQIGVEHEEVWPIAVGRIVRVNHFQLTIRRYAKEQVGIPAVFDVLRTEGQPGEVDSEVLAY